MTNVLTRAEGLKTKTTPTGRTLAVVNVKGGGHYKVAYSDGKGGTLPDHLRGTYTTIPRATTALMNYLTDFWNTSDSVKTKKA